MAEGPKTQYNVQSSLKRHPFCLMSIKALTGWTMHVPRGVWLRAELPTLTTQHRPQPNYDRQTAPLQHHSHTEEKHRLKGDETAKEKQKGKRERINTKKEAEIPK